MKKFSDNKETVTGINESSSANIENLDIKNMLYRYINEYLTIKTYGAYDPFLVGQVNIDGKEKLINAIANWLVANNLVKEDNSYNEDLSIFEGQVNNIYDSKIILERMRNILNSDLPLELKNKMYTILDRRYEIIK